MTPPHVWVIEQEQDDGRWLPTSCESTRTLARLETKWLMKFDRSAYRVAKYVRASK
ncbi:MAG TPA: hypothetical protein VM285_13960 [Polyangia bacterium]|nr:hypothetical protein [Polyangia bacterium]